jgi:hypothetical protein
MTEEWVLSMCKTWARQKARVWLGGHGGHVDGWPPISMAGKLREELEGAGQGKIEQHFAEVLVGDALLVQRAIEDMPWSMRLVLHLHYLAMGNVKEKAAFAAVSRAHYWNLLGRAHARVAGFTEFGEKRSRQLRA